MKAALLLSCALLAGCDRGFDDVPPAVQLRPEGRHYYKVNTPSDLLYLYHDATTFDGNDVEGEPVPLTLCPDPRVIVGLSIATNHAGYPTAMSLRCATLAEDGTLGLTVEGPRIGPEPSTDTPEQVLDCPAGWMAVSWRGAVQAEGETVPAYVTRIGLECAEPQHWLQGVDLPSYVRQVGVSAFGDVEFVEGCTPKLGILKGLSARVSSRHLENVSHACVKASYE